MIYLKGFGKYPKGPQLHEKTLDTKKTYNFPDNSLKKEHSRVRSHKGTKAAMKNVML
jgi:hypothetical protein